MDMMQTMLPKLRLNYMRELPERFNELEHLVMEMERMASLDGIFNELYRQVHSLKGSGGTYGLHFISTICHPLEDLLSGLMKQPERLQDGFTDIALAYIDLLRLSLDKLEDGIELGREIEDKLRNLRLRAFSTTRTALIVEASSSLVHFLSESLQQQRFKVEIMEDGYAALGRALAEPFDLLITGFEIKRLNGLALISALQLAGGRQAKTRTILLTANTTIKGLKNSPDYILTKDAKLKESLHAAVREIILAH